MEKKNVIALLIGLVDVIVIFCFMEILIIFTADPTFGVEGVIPKEFLIAYYIALGLFFIFSQIVMICVIIETVRGKLSRE